MNINSSWTLDVDDVEVDIQIDDDILVETVVFHQDFKNAVEEIVDEKLYEECQYIHKDDLDPTQVLDELGTIEDRLNEIDGNALIGRVQALEDLVAKLTTVFAGHGYEDLSKGEEERIQDEADATPVRRWSQHPRPAVDFIPFL